jgi:leader peptidase (prepilin peptidase) / N-methyltransferase
LSYFLLFIIGTIIGSFLNVCIHRLPREESIVFPASHCPYCDHQLAVLDLIPILSYLFLLGRCRYCRRPISWRYPLVETITGLLFVAVAVKYLPEPLSLAFGLLLVALCIISFFIDLEHMVIPDAVSMTGIFAGLGYNYLRSLLYGNNHDSGLTFLSAVQGLLVGAGLLFLIGLFGKVIFKKEAMGEGDLYLGALFGAFLGWQGVLLTIFLAYLLAGIGVIGLLLARKVEFDGYIPFGPALTLGGLLTFFYGQEIIAWYLASWLVR